MTTSPFRHSCFIVALFAAVTTPSSVSAEKTLWELRRGDVFRVETTINRKTTIQLDDAEESVSEFRDTFIFEYAVARELGGGDVAIRVRVAQAARDSEQVATEIQKSQIGLLKNLSVMVVVDRDGVVTQIEGFRDALRRKVENNQTRSPLIDQSISENVFATWINPPFWMANLSDDTKSGKRWERLHELSLGLLGTLRTIATCETGESEDGKIPVQISGDARFKPLESFEKSGNAAILRFKDMEAKMDSFSGTGTIVVLPEPAHDTPPPNTPTITVRRPPFEALSLEFECSGKATATLGDSEKTLRFSQRQTQTSKLLPGYRIGHQRDSPMLIRPQPQ